MYALNVKTEVFSKEGISFIFQVLIIEIDISFSWRFHRLITNLISEHSDVITFINTFHIYFGSYSLSFPLATCEIYIYILNISLIYSCIT
jgi:hypothetical protein